MLDKTDYARSLARGLEVVGIEVIVITNALTGITVNEKNIADMFFLPGQRHFIEGLQFLLGEINLDSLVAVFNLLLDNKSRRTLVVVYAVNEGGVNKSLQICQMLVNHLCHVAVLLQIVDVARHKRTVNIRPTESVQGVEAFIDPDKTFPCLAGAGGIVVTTNLSRPALYVIDKLNEKRPDKTILLILDTFLFLGFLAGFFFRRLTFGDCLSLGFCSSSILFISNSIETGI